MHTEVDMHRDVEGWNSRYAGELAEAPVAPIGLDPTTIPAGGLFLDVACGLGAQAVWAARNGFDVVAIDSSDVAVDATNAFASEHHVGDKVDARVHDLANGLPAELMGECDVVVCQRYRDPALYAQLVEALAPDGTLVVTVLSEIGTDRSPGPFTAAPGELVKAFEPLDVKIESHTEADGWATIVARKPL